MSTWTPERIAEITRLWGEGLTTAEIGKVVGVSKNAVVGKAHRLGLPARPSPIRRNNGNS
ncbi:MAG: GcrA cell cycle regulator, partial [Rhodospirillaceae bacterium]|nr:GcrA cell cycle regulator [Rhodospirillaceae bacterium]